MQERAKPRLIILIIGAFALAISYWYASVNNRGGAEFWMPAGQTVAFIILTIVIVDFAWSLVGGDPIALSIRELRGLLSDMRTSVKLLDDSRRTGVQRVITPSSDKPAIEWMEHLSAARNTVDLMGYTLHVWTKSAGFENTVERLVKNGVRVRLLIMAADNPNLSALINEAQINALTTDAVMAEIHAATRAFKAIAGKIATAPQQGSFEFRVLRDGMIVTQICRFDQFLTSIQYLYSEVASRNPLLEISGSDSRLFAVYTAEFESLWVRATAA